MIPYGSWPSPLSADLVARGMVQLGQVAVNGDEVYWIERRPADGGRQVIVRRTAEGRVQDLTPTPFNVRTRVHEYGGGAFAVADGVLYFCNFSDQRIYRQDVYDGQGELNEPRPLTASQAMQYADGVIDRRRRRMVCVREDSTNPKRETVAALVSLDLDKSDATQVGRVVMEGHDFYAAPRLNPDGTRIAWLAWNHPNMPWNGTELWVAGIGTDGALDDPVPVAGGPDESILSPQWSPNGVLHAVSDRTGWWNLYRITDGAIEALCEQAAEFTAPPWIFGLSTYAFESDERIWCAFTRHGQWKLGLLDTRARRLDSVDVPYTELSEVRMHNGGLLFVAGSPTEPAALMQLETESRRLEVIRRASGPLVDAAFLSNPEPMEWPTGQGETAYGFFYPPRNGQVTAPDGERPPLLVRSHGGPTAAASTAFNPGIQFWTSRGVAVLDVNYRGSTGYGRPYRDRLAGQWGVVDVEDCVNAARELVSRDLVDGRRLAIAGSSAGGLTTLCALTFHDCFTAGASSYGISDLEALARSTHKFESRYLEWLVGPYPERRDLYVARSPIHFTDRLSCALILFQGLDDPVVSPDQAEAMYEAVRSKGLPVAYLPFPGEQHGFRRAETIKRVLEANLFFLGKVFGFEPADAIEPIPIANLA